MASAQGVLYIGVTNNLWRRAEEHRRGFHAGFTKKYHCNILVYYEHYLDVTAALQREKELKKWRREKKEALIDSLNPEWNNLEKIFS